jgi:hypothetical protein
LVRGIALALTLTVALALAALIPRSVPLVGDPEGRFRKVRDLLALGDEAECLPLLTDFYIGEQDQWVQTLSALRRVCDQKATLVFFSQLATALAICGAFALVLSILSV